MNPETRELIDTTDATPEQLKGLRARGFEPVPSELEEAAQKKLAGKKKVKVARLPFTSLAKHAAKRLAVFCDGDFWHGRNWPVLSSKLAQGTNPDYWLAKIRSNIERDKRNTALLEKLGWHVLRLWESDIKQDPSAAASYVRDLIIRLDA